MLNLLNHTSGLGWDLLVDTGEGDDALARFVANLAELELIGSPGNAASYSQAGYSVVGRIMEKVIGRTYEQAVDSLVLEPLGLSHNLLRAGGCDDTAVRGGPQSRPGWNALGCAAVERPALS